MWATGCGEAGALARNLGLPRFTQAAKEVAPQVQHEIPAIFGFASFLPVDCGRGECHAKVL